MEEIKACPFCGSPSERKGNRRYRKGYAATVGCTRCPLKIEQATLCGTVEDAYKHAESLWNRRPSTENKAMTCEGCGYELSPRYMHRCCYCIRHPSYSDKYKSSKSKEDAK
jgi:hypothetical protein